MATIGRIKPMPQYMANFINMINQVNPQIGKLLLNGDDPKQVFENLCQQRGINPDEFIKNFKNQMR